MKKNVSCDVDRCVYCTCGGVLLQLFELSWRQLCAGNRPGHSDLWELHLDVGLLQEVEERGGRDSLGGAIEGTLHHINDHLRPEREREKKKDLLLEVNGFY